MELQPQHTSDTESDKSFCCSYTVTMADWGEKYI